MPRAQTFAALVAGLPPNQALVIASAGVCLIFLELNRPGRILPGAAGLALLLLSAASLAHQALQPVSLCALLLALAVLAAQLWKALPWWLAACATVGLVAALRYLPAHRGEISLATALTCGLSLGLLSTALARIALRARQLKAVH